MVPGRDTNLSLVREAWSPAALDRTGDVLRRDMLAHRGEVRAGLGRVGARDAGVPDASARAARAGRRLGGVDTRARRRLLWRLRRGLDHGPSGAKRRWGGAAGPALAAGRRSLPLCALHARGAHGTGLGALASVRGMPPLDADGLADTNFCARAPPRAALCAESSRSVVLACGMVWKLGKMWSVSSRVRLWRERYMVVRVDRAEFYKSDKEWRAGSIPLKVLGLKLCRATKKQGGQDAGKWVFYLEETACARSHVLAVESEQLRDKWLYLLHAAADPGQAQALISGVMASAAGRDDGVRQEGGIQDAGVHPARDYSQTAQAQGSNALNGQVAQADHEFAQRQSTPHLVSTSDILVPPELVDVSASSSTGTGGLVGGDEETLAKFAQRWKLEAEKMASLAQSSISSKVADVTLCFLSPLWN